MFGAHGCSPYTLSQFKRKVVEAKNELSGKNMLFPSFKEKQFGSNATLHPTWLFQDDLFQVVAHFFAASAGVKHLVQCYDAKKALEVYCCVVPMQLVSLYDHNVVYKHSFSDLDDWLQMESVNILYHETAKRGHQQFDIEKCMDECYQLMKSSVFESWDSRTMLIFIDRRHDKGVDSLFIFQSPNIKSFLDIFKNRILGLQFKVVNDCSQRGGTVVRSWLHYGSGQRLRFWPEHLIWFIPRLFVKQKGHAFIKRLHADDYKHGFCVDLNDPEFNTYYKILTGWTDQSFHQHHDGNSDTIHNSKFRYLNVDHFATWCCDVVIADLNVSWLIEHKSEIHSVFMEFDIDSFRVHQIRGSLGKQFRKRIFHRTQAAKADVHEPLEILLKELSLRMPMNWSHVVSAVSHKICQPISQGIASLRCQKTPLLPNSGGPSDFNPYSTSNVPIFPVRKSSP